MKKVFCTTTNVKNFTSALHRIQSRHEGIPGMALIYGEPGLGKTRAALWWINQQNNDGIFLRTKKLMSGRWLLEELVAELGEAPARKTSDLFRQAIDQLLSRPRTVFVDEVDYLTYDARVIETLRDVHDITGAPVIFIGMGDADKRLARYRHLYDRFSEIVKFSDLSQADIRAIAEQICEVKIEDDAVAWIHGQGAKFRRVVVHLYKAEAVARANNLKQVRAADLAVRHFDKLSAQSGEGRR